MPNIRGAIRGLLEGLEDGDPYMRIPATSRGGAAPPAAAAAAIPVPGEPVTPSEGPRGELWGHTGDFGSTLIYGELTRDASPHPYLAQEWALDFDGPAGAVVGTVAVFYYFSPYNFVGNTGAIRLPTGLPDSVSHVDIALEQVNPLTNEWEEVDNQLVPIYNQGSISSALTPNNIGNVVFTIQCANLVSGWRILFYKTPFAGAIPAHQGLRFLLYTYDESLEEDE